MTQSQLQWQDNKLTVSGELNFQTVPSLVKQSVAMLAQGDAATELVVDLQGVGRSDSSGVALMIEWMRHAEARNKGIRFQNIPSQMQSIARVCGVDEILA